jgi:hypothetical protein
MHSILIRTAGQPCFFTLALAFSYMYAFSHDLWARNTSFLCLNHVVSQVHACVWCRRRKRMKLIYLKAARAKLMTDKTQESSLSSKSLADGYNQ